jgi:hypothetical protein
MNRAIDVDVNVNVTADYDGEICQHGSVDKSAQQVEHPGSQNRRAA